MLMLEARSTYFFEMGIAQYDKYSNDRLKTDKDLLLCIGYMFEQSVELILKQIAFDCTQSYPEVHRIFIVVNFIKDNITQSKLQSRKELLRVLEDIEQNSKVYNSLSYAAKYEPDVRFSVRQLEELIEINEKILRWYRKHGLSNEEYRHG